MTDTKDVVDRRLLYIMNAELFAGNLLAVALEGRVDMSYVLYLTEKVTAVATLLAVFDRRYLKRGKNDPSNMHH